MDTMFKVSASRLDALIQSMVPLAMSLANSDVLVVQLHPLWQKRLRQLPVDRRLWSEFGKLSPVASQTDTVVSRIEVRRTRHPVTRTYYAGLHCVSKNCANLFLSELCQISTDVDNFCRKMAKRLKLCKTLSFSTSPNSHHHRVTWICRTGKWRTKHRTNISGSIFPR